MFEAMPTRCRVSGWRACFAVDAAGKCLPTGSLGHGRNCINARFAAQRPNSFAPDRGYSSGALGALWGTPGYSWCTLGYSGVLLGCSGCTLGYARVLLGCSSGTLPCSDRTRSRSPRATPTATLRSTRSRRRRARRVYPRGPTRSDGQRWGQRARLARSLQHLRRDWAFGWGARNRAQARAGMPGAVAESQEGPAAAARCVGRIPVGRSGLATPPERVSSCRSERSDVPTGATLSGAMRIGPARGGAPARAASVS